MQQKLSHASLIKFLYFLNIFNKLMYCKKIMYKLYIGRLVKENSYFKYNFINK